MVSFFTDRVYLLSSLENDIERVVTISGNDALYPSEQSDTTVDRVPWFSYTTRFYQNQTVSTTELSHSINGWANSMYTSSTTFCGAQARRQLHVGPFHRSLVFWAAWFAHVSASSIHQFCRWDTRHQVFIFQSVMAFHLLIQEFCLLYILPPMSTSLHCWHWRKPQESF